MGDQRTCVVVIHRYHLRKICAMHTICILSFPYNQLPCTTIPLTLLSTTPALRKNQQRLTYTFTFLASCWIIQWSETTPGRAATKKLTGSAATFCPSVSFTAGGLFNPNFSARFLFFSSSAASLAANSLGYLSVLTVSPRSVNHVRVNLLCLLLRFRCRLFGFLLFRQSKFGCPLGKNLFT